MKGNLVDMGDIRQWRSVAVLLLALWLIGSHGLQAQQPVVRKELKRLLEVLPPQGVDAVVALAGSMLPDSSADGITDEKTLLRYFRLLAPESQELVLEFAQSQIPEEIPSGDSLSAPAVPNAPVAQPFSFGNEGMAPRAGPAYVQAAQALPKTQVLWLEEVYDFGRVEQGKMLAHTFHFRNTGQHPLVLTHVEGSCACTVLQWSKEPIAPGQEGHVKVEFQTRERLGIQRKTIALTLNAEPVFKVLQLKGEIVLQGEQ